MEFLSREFRFTLALEIEAYSPFQMILTQSDGTPSPPTRMQKNTINRIRTLDIAAMGHIVDGTLSMAVPPYV
ncbi:hypothetical protein LBMAG48_14920 [Phycisphaerae bacterium]|jgi:hypothetical protein|nr:hypothetical protein LBMAG48_14920 [Phycisphaerae bacterium]